MWKPKSIENHVEATLMGLDVGFVPKEQVCLLRNFEMLENKEISEKERNRIDALLLSDDKENVTLGIKIVENKLNRHGKGVMGTT
jgi:hypothetical protein